MNGPTAVVSQNSAPITSVCGNVVDYKSKSNEANIAEVPPSGPIHTQVKCTNCKSEFGALIENIVLSVNSTGRAKIKIEIEITKD